MTAKIFGRGYTLHKNLVQTSSGVVTRWRCQAAILSTNDGLTVCAHSTQNWVLVCKCWCRLTVTQVNSTRTVGCGKTACQRPHDLPQPGGGRAAGCRRSAVTAKRCISPAPAVSLAAAAVRVSNASKCTQGICNKGRRRRQALGHELSVTLRSNCCCNAPATISQALVIQMARSQVRSFRVHSRRCWQG
jgi:hypothetical protein